MKLSTLLAVGLLVAAVPGFADSVCDQAVGNLVKNCGFETGDFTGWKVSPNDGNTVVAPSWYGLGSSSGDYFASFGSLADAKISQTFTDTVGKAYVFSFSYASDGDLPHDFSAWWNGVELFSVADTPAQRDYTEYSFSVTGTGSDKISFVGSNYIGADALDDVVVNVPEPSSAWLLIGLLGAGALLRRSRRLVGWASR